MKKTLTFIQTFAGQLDIRPEDVVIVISTSGRNPVPIDVAIHCKRIRCLRGFYPVSLLQCV